MIHGREQHALLVVPARLVRIVERAAATRRVIFEIPRVGADHRFILSAAVIREHHAAPRGPSRSAIRGSSRARGGSRGGHGIGHATDDEVAESQHEALSLPHRRAHAHVLDAPILLDRHGHRKFV